MATYVDEMRPTVQSGRWPYSSSCHLLADTLDELHECADSIGLKREWFQDGTLPHYDLVRSKRREAIRLGAIELSIRQVAERITHARRHRGKCVGCGQ